MNDDELIHRAVAAARVTTGLNFSVVAPEAMSVAQKGYRADAFLDLDLPDGHRRLIVECKSRVDRTSMLVQVKSQLDAVRSTDLPLLVTHRMSANMVDQCRQIGLNFIDAAGNCYLRTTASSSSSRATSYLRTRQASPPIIAVAPAMDRSV